MFSVLRFSTPSLRTPRFTNIPSLRAPRFTNIPSLRAPRFLWGEAIQAGYNRSNVQQPGLLHPTKNVGLAMTELLVQRGVHNDRIITGALSN